MRLPVLVSLLELAIRLLVWVTDRIQQLLLQGQKWAGPAWEVLGCLLQRHYLSTGTQDTVSWRN